MVARRVLCFAPTLGHGGADRVMLTLLKHLDRARVTPALALVRGEGPWLEEVPRDVPISLLGTRRLATSVPTLAGIVRRERPDVVFALQGGANLVASAAHAVARSKARLVLSERSPLTRPDRSRTRLALELPAKRLLYARADVVTALSAGVGRELEATLGVPHAKIRVIYNPTVDDDLTRLAALPVDHPWFAHQDAAPVLLAVGRLVDIKDYPTLLAAFARIRAARRTRLAILGDGPLRPALEERARELGVAGDVAFLGFDKNPFRYMARAAAVLHASKAEGLGSVLIQAMACGAPVVATDCEVGPREVIAHGVTGYLVPVGDAGELARRALELLDDPERARAMSAAARRSAQRFAVSTAVAEFEEAILGG